MRFIARTFAVASTLLILIAGRAAFAGSASLAWNPVTDSDLAGYKVYYGTSPGSYTSSVDVGNVTATTISTLTDPMLSTWAGRSVVLAAWLGLGWFLVER